MPVASSATALDFISKMGKVGRVGSPVLVVGTVGLIGVDGALADAVDVVVVVVVELGDELLAFPALLVFRFLYSSNDTCNKPSNTIIIFTNPQYRKI